jgi:transposase
VLDKQSYRRRNEVERLFRRVKAWRRVFTRYDKLDVMFAAFITVAFIAEALRLR